MQQQKVPPRRVPIKLLGEGSGGFSYAPHHDTQLSPESRARDALRVISPNHAHDCKTRVRGGALAPRAGGKPALFPVPALGVLSSRYEREPTAALQPSGARSRPRLPSWAPRRWPGQLLERLGASLPPRFRQPGGLEDSVSSPTMHRDRQPLKKRRGSFKMAELDQLPDESE